MFLQMNKVCVYVSIHPIWHMELYVFQPYEIVMSIGQFHMVQPYNQMV